MLPAQTPPRPPTRLPRYARVAPASPPRIGRAKRRLLEAVGRFHYLSAPQLTRLLYSPRSRSYVLDHLKDLFHAGYLRRVFLPTITPHGSSLAAYALDGKGLAYLRACGAAPEGRFRTSEEAEREWLFLRHALAANDLLIQAQRLARDDPTFRVAALRTERDLKRTPVYVAVGDARVGVVPDGWVDLRRGALRACVAFELDRGTVERGPFQRKLRALLAYAGEPYRAAFGTASLTVAFATTAGPGRLRAMLEWTQRVLEEDGARDRADLFRFAALDPAAIDPRALFFAPIWTCPLDETPLPLLELGVSP